MVELMIKIPEEMYEIIQNSEKYIDEVARVCEEAVKCGITLPKGHGRLIDADAFIDNYEECGWLDDISVNEFNTITPTIIEADKEREGSLDVAIKALEREPCEDAISRKKVIDTIYYECSGENLDIDFAKVLLLQRKINSLPSVKPEPKAAYWVEYKPDHHRCSKCGRDALVKWHNAKRDNIDILTNHCPNCGAKMIGRQRWESDEIDER